MMGSEIDFLHVEPLLLYCVNPCHFVYQKDLQFNIMT